jgi:hypothetical protein
MKKSPGEATTARNLEGKFDRGEDVLDYFDLRKAGVVDPQGKKSAAKTKFTYSVKRNAKRQTVLVREKSARYRKK